jgi:hypothetical protein
MTLAPIYFQFPDKKAALLALDTLQEVGFTADMLEHRHPEHRPTLHVLVEKGDLTSVLEIAQAHGGQLCETADTLEPEVYTSAYGLDGLRIPAHTVTEDLPDSYLAGSDDPHGTSLEEAERIVARNAAEQALEGEEERFDPSGDDYGHFSAGVHL